MAKVWVPSNQFLAQEVHGTIGFLAVTLAVAFGYPFWYGAVAILIVAAIKETLIDPYLEGQSFAQGGWLDFTFYVIGVAIASPVFYFIH